MLIRLNGPNGAMELHIIPCEIRSSLNIFCRGYMETKYLR